jgi:hypothetical protein
LQRLDVRRIRERTMSRRSAASRSPTDDAFRSLERSLGI